jgi:hypothetical protein
MDSDLQFVTNQSDPEMWGDHSEDSCKRLELNPRRADEKDDSKSQTRIHKQQVAEIQDAAEKLATIKTTIINSNTVLTKL